MRICVAITLLWMWVAVSVHAQPFSITYELADEDGDYFVDMYVDEDSIYALTARGCDTIECMTVVKLNDEGNILRSRHFTWMDEGDNDVILKDDSLIVVVGSVNIHDKAMLSFLVLNAELDSMQHLALSVPDSIIGLGIKSVTSFLNYYVVVGFGFTSEEKPDVATLFWIKKESFELDTLVTIQSGSKWTVFTQAFVKDSQLTVSYLVYSGGIFLNRGFIKFDAAKNLIWSWESEPDSYGQRGEDALVLANENMIIEHSVDNRWREFRLICISPGGDVQWMYDDQRHAYGRKSLYHLAQTQNGDIVGCGEIEWPWDPSDITPTGGDGYSGAYLFRMNSETGEMIWERAIIGYDSFWNYAGDFFSDLDELSDGSLIMCGGWQVYDSTAFDGYDSWLVRTDGDGCVIPDCGFPSFTTATIDLVSMENKDHLFSLSPNPSANDITITFDTRINTFDLYYTISTIEGTSFVQNKKLSETRRIDISDLLPGFYFLSVTDEHGRFLQTAKFVKSE